jgi:hypothetical protein
MNFNLKYMRCYRLIIADEGYNGLYLGEKISPDRLNKSHLVLVNKPYSFKENNKDISNSFSLIRFKDYRFNEKNKLILKNMHYLKNFTKGEKSYLEELLKNIPGED